MAKNFGQKFVALQLGMLILGIVLFIGGYMLKKHVSKSPDKPSVEAVTDSAAQQH